MTKKYAKLAKNPGSAKSTELERALSDLTKEKSQLQERKSQLNEQITKAYLDEMAGEEVNPKALQDELSTISYKLSALDIAEASLKEHLEKARTRESKARLQEIEKEIASLRQTQETHYEKGLKLLAQALAYLGSAWNFPGSDPVQAGERIRNISLTAGSTFKQTYLKVYEKVEKPAAHAASKIDELNQEKAELEKALRVGSFAPSERKEPEESEPPKVFLFGTDAPMG